MKKLNSTPYAISLGRQSEKENEIDLVDCSPENMLLSNCIYVDLEDFKHLEELKLDIPIWYVIEQFDDSEGPNRELIAGERGIGFVKKVGKKFVLVREKVFFMVSSHIKPRATEKPVEFDPERVLIITTRTPEAFSDMFISSHSVLSADEEFCPQNVSIENKSVLGRNEEGIESIQISDLPQMMGNKFELTGNNSIIISNTLFLKSQKTRPRSAKAGQIIYNSRKKCFEGYDGTKWRSFTWE